jgi:hypothetical protein
VNAYNKFGVAKAKNRIPTQHRPGSEGKHLHHFRDPPFSVLDFI